MRDRVYHGVGAASFLLGLLLVVGGAGHAWSIAEKTIREDRDHDFRQASLFTVGWILVFTGGLIVVFARGIWERRRGAVLGSVLAAAGFFGHFLLILAQQPEFWWGVPLYGGFLAVGGWMAARGPRPAPD